MNNWSIADFSEQTGYNTSYLSRLFKQTTGKGFVQYVTEQRIEAAKKMILDGKLSMLDIANVIGYKDYKHFRKLFKQYTGTCPTQYRSVHNKERDNCSSYLCCIPNRES